MTTRPSDVPSDSEKERFRYWMDMAWEAATESAPGDKMGYAFSYLIGVYGIHLSELPGWDAEEDPAPQESDKG